MVRNAGIDSVAKHCAHTDATGYGWPAWVAFIYCGKAYPICALDLERSANRPAFLSSGRDRPIGRGIPQAPA